MLFGCSLTVFASSHLFWLSRPLLPATGFGMMQIMAASNTILQTIVDDAKRGRVMAFYSMAVMGRRHSAAFSRAALHRISARSKPLSSAARSAWGQLLVCR
jgi:hypothetical protein